MQPNYLLYLLICFSWTGYLTSHSHRLIIRDEYDSCPFLSSEELNFYPRQLNAQEHKVKLASSTHTLHGSSALGYYFTTLQFGTPAQEQTLIVDTGSSITTIPCTECGKNCGTNHFNEFFNPKKSETFEDMKCRERNENYVCTDCNDHCSFSIGYSEGSSYIGRYKKDYVSFKEFATSRKNDSLDVSHQHVKNLAFLENESSKFSGVTKLRPISDVTTSDITQNFRVLMPFGCTLKETNLFLTQEADGILGLGVNTNSVNSPPNLIDKLHYQNSSIANAFSLCLGPEGGYLAVGGFNKTFHSLYDEIKFIPYDGRFFQYRIHWKNVRFQGKELNISPKILNEGKGAYIDSGTTLLYTSETIANIIKGSLLNFCEENKIENCGGSQRENMCWIYDKNKYITEKRFFATFGNFTFGFGEDNTYDYEWHPEDYLYYVPGKVEYYCFGLQAISGSRTIFGGTFMKNHDILFDKENKRIGFIRANCSAEYSMESYPKHRDPEPNNKYVIVFVIFLGLGSIIFIYFKKNKKWISEIPIRHFELPISPGRKDSSSSGSLESTDLRLLSDSSGDTSLQEIEDQFSV